MNAPLKITIAAMSLVFAVGCAKNDNQKAVEQQQQTKATQADADKASADLMATLPQLQQAPMPTDKFTEQELAAYEELVRKNEENLVRIQSYHGKDGLVISNPESLEQARAIIVEKKQAVQNVRAQHAANGVAHTKQIQIDQLVAQYKKDSNFLTTEGIPTKNWAPEKIKAYEEALNRTEATLHELEVIDGASVPELAREKLAELRRAFLEGAKANQQ